MTVLITGGAGYIGSNLARLLVKKKNKVCIVDNLSENNKLLIPKKAIFYNCNILNIKKIRKIIIKNKISSIFHLAAKIKVPESEIKPDKYFLNRCKAFPPGMEKGFSIKKFFAPFFKLDSKISVLYSGGVPIKIRSSSKK